MPQLHENQPNFPPPPPPRSNIWSSGSQHPQEMDSAYSSPVPPRDSDKPWTPGRPPIGFDQEQPPAPPPRYEAAIAPPRRSRKPAALVASAAALAGIGFGINNISNSEEIEPATTTITGTTDASSHPVEQEQPLASVVETESKPSADLIASFEADLADSACDTPETAASAARYYHEIFESLDLSNMTMEEFRAKANEASANLITARERLDFLALPANYDVLSDDLFAFEQQIPLSEYQAALTEMLAPADIQVVYEWDIPTAFGSELPTADQAIPIALDTPEAQVAMKHMTLGAIESFAVIPQDVLQEANVKQFYFGDIIYENDAIKADNDTENDRLHSGGMARLTILGNSIVLDASPRYYQHPTEGRRLTSHEVSHALQYEMCWALTDTAWNNQLPADFVPHAVPDDALGTEYTTIENIQYDTTENNKEVVAMNTYGTSSFGEQHATLVGEHLLDPTNTEMLFYDPDNMTSLYRQLSLAIARFETTKPHYAEYLKRQLILAQFEQAAYGQSDELLNTFNDTIRSQAEDPSSEPLFDSEGTLVLPEELTAMNDESKAWSDIGKSIHNAQVGVLATD